VAAADGSGILRGVEDIAVDRKNGRAYLSAADRWNGRRATERLAPDGIYAVSLAALADGDPQRVEAAALTASFAKDNPFHPHGIDTFVGPDGGAEVLFAVNHRPAPASGGDPETTVEIFDVVGQDLVHRATVRDKLLTSPNDLAAAGRRSFYLANSYGSAGAFDQIVENLTGRGRGSVVHYDAASPAGPRMQPVAERISFANGIALSKDRARLYVASSRAKELLVYNLGGEAAAAEPRREPDARIPLPFGPDNLDWGPDGKLYVGGHPDLIRFAIFAYSGAWPVGLRTSPSQVSRLDTQAPKPEATIESLYADDGERLSASSVGVAANGLLLIGTVFADRIGVCRL
jgi:hypothetical protein